MNTVKEFVIRQIPSRFARKSIHAVTPVYQFATEVANDSLCPTDKIGTPPFSHDQNIQDLFSLRVDSMISNTYSDRFSHEFSLAAASRRWHKSSSRSSSALVTCGSNGSAFCAMRIEMAFCVFLFQ